MHNYKLHLGANSRVLIKGVTLVEALNSFGISDQDTKIHRMNDTSFVVHIKGPLLEGTKLEVLRCDSTLYVERLENPII